MVLRVLVEELDVRYYDSVQVFPKRFVFAFEKLEKHREDCGWWDIVFASHNLETSH